MSTIFAIPSSGQSERFLIDSLCERGFFLVIEDGKKMFRHEGAGWIHYHGLSDGVFTFERFGANDPEPITDALEEILEGQSLTEHSEGFDEMTGTHEQPDED